MLSQALLPLLMLTLLLPLLMLLQLQAMDSLGSFFEACAQIEIDEYRDYDKALQVGWVNGCLAVCVS